MELSFWAIITSIVIGVASNMLTPYITRVLGNLSVTVKQRNEKKKLVFNNSVQFILDHPQEETNLLVRCWGRDTRAWIVMAASAILMFSNNPLEVLIGFIFFLLGNYGSTRSDKLWKILYEVARHKKVNHPGIDLDQ